MVLDYRNPEVRWGDHRTLSLEIPAAGGVVAGPMVQMIDITDAAKVWSVLLYLEWTNPIAGIVGEDLIADLFVQSGIGSALVSTYRQLLVPQASPLPFANTIVDAWPAAKLVVGGRLRVQNAAAGVGRTYVATLGVTAAPYNRTDI